MLKRSKILKVAMKRSRKVMVRCKPKCTLRKFFKFNYYLKRIYTKREPFPHTTKGSQ